MEKSSEEIGKEELNEIILNIIPNGWISQDYVQDFDFEAVSFKKYINMF